MRIVRPALLLLLIAVTTWFAFGQPRTAHALIRRAFDRFDHRPARNVLILGNSRTFYHDMPDMIRDMADSAGDPQRYDISVDAQPGASLETLWQDRGVRDLVAQRWDDVIVQGESRAEATDEQAVSFQRYGRLLLDAARHQARTAWLVANWNYEAALWDDGDPDGSGRTAYYAATQTASRFLAEQTGAKVADIGTLWGQVRQAQPRIALTEDGNHPTLAGSYLFALMLYGELSRRDVERVAYVPGGLDQATAAVLREQAAAFDVARD